MFVVKVFCKIETSDLTENFHHEQLILSTRLTAPGSPRMIVLESFLVKRDSSSLARLQKRRSETGTKCDSETKSILQYVES